MKKLLMIALISMLGYQANAQFSAGVWGGLPIGDAGDIATFSLGVDLTYLFDVSEDFGVGPTTGYSHSFGDSVDTGFGTYDYDDSQFIPIGAAGRYSFSDAFAIGVDLGYALGLNDGNDGGFYYAPKAQYSVSELIAVVLAYRNVSVTGGTFSILSLGLEFGL
jgi:Outer membrane protein beta-barrel domain